VAALPFGSGHLPANRVIRAAATRSPTSTMHTATPLVKEMLGWLSNVPDTPPRELPPPRRTRATTPSSSLVERSRAHGISKPDPCADATEGAAADPARILIADDNADMRQFLAGLLGERYEVEVVADGTAALAAARSLPPGARTEPLPFAIAQGYRRETVPVLPETAPAAASSSCRGGRLAVISPRWPWSFPQSTAASPSAAFSTLSRAGSIISTTSFASRPMKPPP